MAKRYLEYIANIFRDIPISAYVGLLLVFCVGTVLLLSFMGWKKGIKWSICLLLIEYVFLFLLSSVILRPVLRARKINLSPFWCYRPILNGDQSLMTQVIMNVVVFIPIGFLLGCSFSSMKWRMVLLIGGLVSITVEVLQFVFKRGLMELDDVLHNVLGCLIGYGVYKGIA